MTSTFKTKPMNLVHLNRAISVCFWPAVVIRERPFWPSIPKVKFYEHLAVCHSA